MNVGKETLKQLLSSLSDYNPTAYDLMGKVAVGLLPVAFLIMGVLMYLEFTELNKKFALEVGRINLDIFIAVAWKYFLAFAVVSLSGQILDTIIWIINAGGHILNKIVTTDSDLSIAVPEIKGKLNLGQKMVINSISGLAHMCQWGAEITTKVLVWLRAYMLYLVKGLAPLLLATLVSDEWRSIGLSFIKQFSAIIVQGILLLLILKLYPAIVSNDMFDLVAKGNFQENLLAFFLVLVKSGVFIFVLISSQQTARRWMGV